MILTFLRIIAEEAQDAQRSVKRYVLWSFVMNWLVLVVVGFTVVFCSGDAFALFDTPTHQPYIQLFKNITHDTAGTAALIACILTPTGYSAFSGQAAAARSLWAFADNGGFVFPTWTAKVSPTRHIPARAIIVCWATTSLLSLLGLAAASVLPIVFSLDGGALFSTYELTVCCLLYYRWQRGGILVREEGRPDTFWQRIYCRHFDRPTFLGRYGFLVNLFCAAVIPVIVVFLMWPTVYPVTTDNM